MGWSEGRGRERGARTAVRERVRERVRVREDMAVRLVMLEEEVVM